MESILFLSPYNFSKNDGGKFLFNEFLERLDPNLLDWFICSESSKNRGLNYEFNSISCQYNFIFDNKYFNLVSRKIFFFGFFFYYFKYNFYSKLISKKICLNIDKYLYTKLWVYASHSTISILYFILKKRKIKYHISVQDDFATHLSSFESNHLSLKFKYIIENANSIDFISSSMENYYRNKYDITAKTCVFYVSQKSKLLVPPVIRPVISTIGYAGNIWCGPSFIPFLDAIKEVNFKYNFKIKFKIFTSNFPSKLFNDYLDFVENCDFMPYDLLLNELHSCDLLYLPMTFNEKQRIINITSFPSKIITYLNSGIPILNHSPSDSSTNFFIQDNKVGFSINSNDKNDFVNFLLNDNYIIRKTFSSNSSVVLQKFDVNSMFNSLKSLIFNYV